MPGILTRDRGHARIVRQGKRGGDVAAARGDGRSGASAALRQREIPGAGAGAMVELIAESSATD
jgi:hypothetical protein